jgi:hypothetical protein
MCVCVLIYIYTSIYIIYIYMATVIKIHVPPLFCNNFSAECVCFESNSKTAGIADLCYDSSRAPFGWQYSAIEGVFYVYRCTPHNYRTVDTAPVHPRCLICQRWRCWTPLGPTVNYSCLLVRLKNTAVVVPEITEFTRWSLLREQRGETAWSTPLAYQGICSGEWGRVTPGIFFEGRGFNKFSWGQTAERTGIWER